MTISDVLTTTRILLCPLDLFPIKVEFPNPTNKYGDSPMHGHRAEGIEDASECSISQSITPSTAHYPARRPDLLLLSLQPRKAVVNHHLSAAATVALWRIEWHLPQT